MAVLESINPSTGERVGVYPEMSLAEAEGCMHAVDRAATVWRDTDAPARAAKLGAAAEILRQRQTDYARLMASEMGKPVSQGRAEIEKCAWVCEYYARHGADFLAPEKVATEAGKSYVAFCPLGVVLAIMPWNFPFWQVFRFAAPALMAGNGAVLKHASNVSGCALAIETLWRDAGLPPDLFRTLLIGSSQVSAVLEHPVVRAVTLTGSTPAGRQVAARAGALLKKCVLELGGSDPYLVLADADLESAAAVCAAARIGNAGQSCIAAKRLIVVESVRSDFEARLVRQMQAFTLGDPLSESTGLGPLARADLRDEVHQQVQQSIAAGARLRLGGTLPGGPGNFYPPTVLTGVQKGMPAYDQEVFGPVAAVVPARDEAAAIDLANDSPFGLGAAVFTGDARRGEQIAAGRLEAGCCFVNAAVKSDPRLPFGGVKQSGFGRELSGFGLREFVNIKTVYVK
jgi:succinate-semialdehyde dehydrogenase / glutarate-semialdehyde dehydrogenase